MKQDLWLKRNLASLHVGNFFKHNSCDSYKIGYKRRIFMPFKLSMEIMNLTSPAELHACFVGMSVQEFSQITA